MSQCGTTCYVHERNVCTTIQSKQRFSMAVRVVAIRALMRLALRQLLKFNHPSTPWWSVINSSFGAITVVDYRYVHLRWMGPMHAASSHRYTLMWDVTTYGPAIMSRYVNHSMAKLTISIPFPLSHFESLTRPEYSISWLWFYDEKQCVSSEAVSGVAQLCIVTLAHKRCN